jgi:hypothetical protein
MPGVLKGNDSQRPDILPRNDDNPETADNATFSGCIVLTGRASAVCVSGKPSRTILI